ncbi:putative quinol monooxygenase [Cupriavidus basilensis]|uniref:putative quinol monooxygenase n=1 Tax=Cupriavidus basilensis TaxID=68895 RepID=UPI003D32628A
MGCERSILSQSRSPHGLRFFEIYASEDAYRRHSESPHLRNFVAVTETLIRSKKEIETPPVQLSLKP